MTEDQKTPDIEKLRAVLSKKLAEKHAIEDAIAAKINETEKLALETVKTVMQTCDGLLERVEAYPMHFGFQLSTNGHPKANLIVPKYVEPQGSTHICVAKPEYKNRTGPVCHYNAESAAMALVRLLAE